MEMKKTSSLKFTCEFALPPVNGVRHVFFISLHDLPLTFVQTNTCKVIPDLSAVTVIVHFQLT